MTSFGKVVIIGTMFIGRIGPLALLASLAFRSAARRPCRHPEEKVLIG